MNGNSWKLLKWRSKSKSYETMYCKESHWLYQFLLNASADEDSDCLEPHFIRVLRVSILFLSFQTNITLLIVVQVLTPIPGISGSRDYLQNCRVV